jgi:hypothetical protein
LARSQRTAACASCWALMAAVVHSGGMFAPPHGVAIIR